MGDALQRGLDNLGRSDFISPVGIPDPFLSKSKDDGWISPADDLTTGDDSTTDPKQCNDNDDDKCNKQHKMERVLCYLAGSRYSGDPAQAIKICRNAAFQRYVACKKGTPKSD